MDDALTLLKLQIEWGADEAIDLTPIGRARPVDIVQPVLLRPVDPAPTAIKGTQTKHASALSARAGTLTDLRSTISSFGGCALRDTASNTVFAEGNPTSTTLIISDPPGREEDRSGHPFAGSEGQLLDQMLSSIGLSRTELLLTPLIPWRPPGGRLPSPGEIAICLPFLFRLIELQKPRRLVIFGNAAARAVLPQAQIRRRSSRSWLETTIPGNETTWPTLVLPGLSDMLKTPLLRRDAWFGLRLLHYTLTQT